MKFKTCLAAVKAADAASDDGVFEAIVSVFNNVDSMGDVVRPGAFKDTLTYWKASGDPLPVYWSHRMDDPEYNIGAVVEAAELAAGDTRIPDWAPDAVKQNGGLYVKGQLDTGADASPKAVATRRLLKQRRVTQFSYAYDEEESGFVKDDGREVWELRKLKLYEVSPTPIGANQDTTLIGAKAFTLPDDPEVAQQVAGALIAIDAHIDAADDAVDQLLALLGLPDPPDPGDEDEGAAEGDAAKARAAAIKTALLKRRVRRATAKAGRVLSSKNEDAIKQAVQLLEGVLSALDKPADDDTAKREEPAAVKRKEPNHREQVQLLTDLAALEVQVA